MTLKVTKKLLTKCLISTYGNVFATMKLLREKYGIDIKRNAICDRIRRNPEIKDAVDEAMENLIDVAEHGLAYHINKKHMPAITFMLKTKGKARGYSEAKTVMNDMEGNPVDNVIKVEFVDSKKEAILKDVDKMMEDEDE